MVEIPASDLEPMASAGLVASKCQAHYNGLVKTKKRKQQIISLVTTGDKKTNQLLNFLQCQVKATKACEENSKAYNKCHQSFMGTGSYQGRKHCGLEMEALWHCVTATDDNDGR